MNQNQRLFLMISLMFLLLLLLPAPQSGDTTSKSTNSTDTSSHATPRTVRSFQSTKPPKEMQMSYFGKYEAKSKMPLLDPTGRVYLSFLDDQRIFSERMYNKRLKEWEEEQARQKEKNEEGEESEEKQEDSAIASAVAPEDHDGAEKPTPVLPKKPEFVPIRVWLTRLAFLNSYLNVYHFLNFDGTQFDEKRNQVFKAYPDMHIARYSTTQAAKNFSCPQDQLMLEIDHIEFENDSDVNPGNRVQIEVKGFDCNSGDNYDSVSSGEDNWDFHITANLMPFEIIHEAKLKNYVLTLLFFCMINIFMIFHEIKNVILSDTYARKYSLASISMLAITDLGTAIIHFLKAFEFKEIHGIILMLSYFFLYLALDNRLLLFCWRAQNPDVFQQDLETRRAELGRFYSKFYAALLVVFILYILDSFTIILIVISQLYWVPQIRYNAIKGHKNFFTPKLLILLPLSRIIFPLYLIACPENVLFFEQFPKVAILMVTLVVLQSLTLYLQGKLGSRFFIPRQFLPPKFNYYHNFSEEEIGPDGEIQECCICLNKLNSSSDGGELDTKLMKIMVTPCGHKFHSNCLENWMDVKMECPVCRVSLPPLDQRERAILWEINLSPSPHVLPSSMIDDST